MTDFIQIFNDRGETENIVVNTIEEAETICRIYEGFTYGVYNDEEEDF